MVRRRPDSSEKQARILDAAEALFMRHGYEATSLAMLKDACGMSAGSIVHFIGEKPAIARAVHGRLRDRIVGEIAAAADRPADEPIPMAVARVIDAAAQTLARTPGALGLVEALESHPLSSDPFGDRLVARLADVLVRAPCLASGVDASAATSVRLFAVVLAPLFAKERLMAVEPDSDATPAASGAPDYLVSMALAGLDSHCRATPDARKQGNGRSAEVGDAGRLEEATIEAPPRRGPRSKPAARSQPTNADLFSD